MNESNERGRAGSVGLWVGFPLAILLCGGVALVGAGQSNSSELGEMAWPGEDARSLSEFVEVGESVFANDTQATTVATRPVASLELEPMDETRSEIVITEEDGEETRWVQEHSPAELDGHTTLNVEPDDLNPTVALHPIDGDERSRYVLYLTGPPGSFGVDGPSAQETLENLATRLGFPATEVSPSEEGTVDRFPNFYGWSRFCYEASEEGCQATAALSLDCSTCRMASIEAAPDETAFPGLGLVVLDEEDRMLAASVSYVFDPAEDARIDPAVGVDRAEEELRDRGYQVVSPPNPDSVDVVPILAEDRVEVVELRYEWSFGVSEEEADRDNPTEIATVAQDATTGEVLSVEVEPAEAVSPTQGLDVPGLAPGILAVVLAFVAICRSRS
jgi:hypothetical protein